MTAALKDRIVRAAVAWERKLHEKVGPNQYREMADVESPLVEAVREYTSALLDDDTVEEA